MKDKYIPCRYCYNALQISVEKHHIQQHEQKCFFKDENLNKLAQYFNECLLDISQLKRKTLHRYCVQEAKVLSPVSMSKYLNQSEFKKLVVQLLVILYKVNKFDWEYSELLIHHLTNGRFYMNDNLLDTLSHNCRDIRGFQQIDTEQNFQTLFNKLIVRARKDLDFIVGNKDENNEEIEWDTIYSAVQFLLNNDPGQIDHARQQKKIGAAAKVILSRLSHRQ